MKNYSVSTIEHVVKGNLIWQSLSHPLSVIPNNSTLLIQINFTKLQSLLREKHMQSE